MARESLPSADRLRQLFDYESETGLLTWKCGRNASRHAGHKCFRSSQKGGGPKAIRVSIGGREFAAHQIIWIWCGREIPPGTEIDHENGNPFDNRLSNLRVASHVENMRNSRLYENSTTGLKGVHWHSRDRRFMASIRVNKKLLHLGSFKTAEAAAECYRQAAIEHFGKFARPS